MPFRSATANPTRALNVVVAKPAGCVDGDVLIAVIALGNNGDGINYLPSGFTPLLNTAGNAGAIGNASPSGCLCVGYKVASSEGASFTFQNPANLGVAAMLCFHGVTVDGLLQTANRQTSPASTPWDINATGVTVATASDVIWFGRSLTVTDVDALHTPPDGYTLVHDMYATPSVNFATAFSEAVGAGATGTVTGTGESSGASSEWSAFLLALPINAAPALLIDEQPTATQSGYLIDPAPVVHVLDAEGALNTSFTGDVTASLLGSGGVLLGTLTVAAVAGVATFSNLRPCEAGSYQLRFSATGYANLDSAVFAVTAGEGSTNVIVHQEAPMRPIRRNEPTAELRDIPIEILADDGSPWDGDPDDGGGLKAQLSQNFGTETPSPANIVKLSAGNFRVRPTDAYTDIVEGSIIKARVPAAAGRREAVGWAHIIPADTYVSADAARKALVDAVIIASDGGGGYDVVKQPESNQIQRTIPGVGVVTITAVFSPSVPGIVSAGGS